MAYMDNEDFWCEIFNANLGDPPAWWIELMKSLARFNRAISTLHDYSLLEMSAALVIRWEGAEARPRHEMPSRVDPELVPSKRCRPIEAD